MGNQYLWVSVALLANAGLALAQGTVPPPKGVLPPAEQVAPPVVPREGTRGGAGPTPAPGHFPPGEVSARVVPAPGGEPAGAPDPEAHPPARDCWPGPPRTRGCGWVS